MKIKLIIALLLTIFASCSPKVVTNEQDNLYSFSSNSIKLRLSLEKSGISSQNCGFVQEARLYKAEVMDESSRLIFGNYILLYVLCGETINPLFLEREFTLSSDLSDLQNYQISDVSMVEKSDKFKMKKFIYLN